MACECEEKQATPQFGVLPTHDGSPPFSERQRLGEWFRQRELKREKILHEIAFLLFRQAEAKTSIVMIDHGEQRRGPAIVKEPALLVSEDPRERRCTVAVVRRPFGLEIIDANVFRRMQIPP